MKYLIPSLLLFAASSCFAQNTKTINQSGNPIFKGWYADPEAAIFNNKYWVYPTYSAKYKEQVFMDAFSSDDLVNWKKHEHIVDTAAIKWANKALRNIQTHKRNCHAATAVKEHYNTQKPCFAT